jgi:hypothetical protein
MSGNVIPLSVASAEFAGGKNSRLTKQAILVPNFLTNLCNSLYIYVGTGGGSCPGP